MVMKYNKILKSQECTDGRQQQMWTNKEEGSSSLPYIEAIKYTLIVNVHEEGDVALLTLRV